MQYEWYSVLCLKRWVIILKIIVSFICLFVDEEDILEYKVSQLSVSPENTILQYLHLEVGEGVYLSPVSVPSGPLTTQILNNFRAAAQIIHRLGCLQSSPFVRGHNKKYNFYCRKKFRFDSILVWLSLSWFGLI